MKKFTLSQLGSTALSALALVGAYAIANILGAHDVFAQTTGGGNTNVAGLISNVATNVGGVPKLIYTASYIGGTTALMMGAFKLKAHAENPGQTPMQQGLARLGVGGALIALPTVGGAIANTIDGGSTGQLTSQQSQFNGSITNTAPQ